MKRLRSTKFLVVYKTHISSAYLVSNIFSHLFAHTPENYANFIVTVLYQLKSNLVRVSAFRVFVVKVSDSLKL